MYSTPFMHDVSIVFVVVPVTTNTGPPELEDRISPQRKIKCAATYLLSKMLLDIQKGTTFCKTSAQRDLNEEKLDLMVSPKKV